MNRIHLLSRNCLVGLGLLIFLCPDLKSEIIDDWTLHHPIPSYADLYNGAYGNGIYVIVGRGVGLHTTSDFSDWETDYRDEFLENVIFADGQFTISGSAGEILRSVDGMSWTTHVSGADVPLYGLAYGAGRYVVIGEDGVSSTSTNGTSWTPGSTGDGNLYWSAAYGEGRFVAVSEAGTVMTSTDGSSWSAASLGASVPGYVELYVVTYGAGRFIVGGYFWDDTGGTVVEGSLILSSEDGLTWSRVVDSAIPNDGTTPGNTQRWVDEVKFNGSQFVAAGDGGLLLVSANGLEWSTRSAGTTSTLYGLAFGDSQTVIFGVRGVYSVSSDLTNWTPSSPAENIGYGKWQTLGYDGLRFVMGGQSGLLVTSTDGVEWTRGLKPASGTFNDVAHGDGRWVLTSWVNLDNIPLITSTDGTNWALANLPVGTDECNGVAFGNGTFVASVAVGHSLLLVSTNGMDWTANSPVGVTTLRGVDFGGGTFVSWTSAVEGNPIRVAVSPDGVNWQVHDTPVTSGAITAAAYGNGRWNFVGTSGLVLSTTDFISWSQQQIVFGSGSPEVLDGVSFASGHWVIVGRRHLVWSSSDGMTWDDAFTTGMDFAIDRFWDVVFDGDSFWACGESGVLMQSQSIGEGGPEPASLAIRSGGPGSVVVVIDGQAGDDWELVFSPVLPATSWEIRDSVTLGETPTEIIEPIGDAGHGFYRLMEPTGP